METRRACEVMSAWLLIFGHGYALAGILQPHGLSAPLRVLSVSSRMATSETSVDDGVRALGQPVAYGAAWSGNPPPLSARPYVNTGGTRVNVEGLPARAGAARGAVGPSHYLQLADGELAIYDKLHGRLQFGPTAVNSLFANAKRAWAMGTCSTSHGSEATVLHDQLANRWIITLRAAGGAKAGRQSNHSYYQCIAVSESADPAGAYYRYAMVMKDPQGRAQYFDDPKLALRPEAYYLSFNLFKGSAGRYLGPRVCAVDRRSLIEGKAATVRCRDAGQAYGPLTPATLSGQAQPDDRGGALLVSLGPDGRSLRLLRFSFGSGRFARPVTLPVQPFATINGESVIGQPAPGSLLGPLADRLAPQAVYRHLQSGHALTANHSLRLPDGRIGIRWYDIRRFRDDLLLAQEGTLTDGTDSRWMGNIGMDKAGNIAIGYSVASPDTAPGVRYTGRDAGDVPGTMRGEEVVVNGAGVQTQADTAIRASGGMTLDPLDDCTFWTTQRYVPVTGVATWRTRIASFRFRSCS